MLYCTKKTDLNLILPVPGTVRTSTGTVRGVKEIRRQPAARPPH